MRESFFLALALLPLVLGFGFTLTSSPVQCADLSLTWTTGTPPYELTLVPLVTLNASAILGSPEGLLRNVLDTNTSSTSWSGPLPFPNNSTFVAVLSDATGFGSGGTSALLTVGEGSDESCLPTAASQGLNFTFFVKPGNLSQCGEAEFVFAGVMTPPVTLSAVVVGGVSQQLSSLSLLEWNGSTLASLDGQVVGFGSLNWTVDIPAESEVVFLAGDAWGRASGAYSDIVLVGNSSDASCLEGSPFTASAGAPTSPTSSPSSSSSSSSKSETGSIAGGVVGGVAVVLLIGLGVVVVLRRRNMNKRRRSMHERGIGLRQYPLEGFRRGAGLTEDAFADE